MARIDALPSLGKKKQGMRSTRVLPLVAALIFFVCALPSLSWAADPTPPRGADGSNTLGTRTGGATIGTDPRTGDRTLATPDPPAPQENHPLGPIFVSPEIYPDRPGPNPPRPPRPPRR